MTPALSAQLAHQAETASAAPIELAQYERDAEPRAMAHLLGDEAAAVPARLWATALHDPARHFLREPGKGFRATLVQLGWQLAGGATGQCPPELVVVLEWLHAGSLIVDDIEDGSLTRQIGRAHV